MNDKDAQLNQLLGGYFHQDWDIEGETDAEVASAYLRDVSPEQLRETVAELDGLIHLCSAGQKEAESALAETGCEYYYEADGWTAIEWLRRLRTFLPVPNSNKNNSRPHERAWYFVTDELKP